MTDEYLRQSLADFRVLRMRFILSPVGRLFLGSDEMKGDKWRGGIGEALGHLTCCKGWGQSDCKSCEMREECFYFEYFESGRPHPYVIHPALDSKGVYDRGEEVRTDIVLIGEARSHLYKFIRAMEELGLRGIGKDRGRFYVRDMTTEDIAFSDLPDAYDITSVMIELLTPLKMKEEEKGIYYRGLSFPIFFKLLLKRLINLNRLYGSGMGFEKEKLEQGKRNLLAHADTIQMEPHTEWADFRRFSSRQQRLMKMGGQRGIFVLSGEIKPFSPYLKFGEIIGAGQHTTSGFGRYTIKNVSPHEK